MSQYQPYESDPLQYSNLPPQAGGYPPQPPVDEGLGGWILAIFLTLIPVVNLVYLLVLAFGTGTSIAKRNFARASLIWMAVGIVLSIIGFIMLAVFGAAMFNEISNTYPMELDY